MTIAADVGDSGALQLRAADRTYQIRTRISRPDGKWHEPRALNAGETVSGGGSATVNWSVGQVHIQRRVVVRRDHVNVQDVFHNTGNTLIGLIVEHHATVGRERHKTYLAGLPSEMPSNVVREPANPTAFGESEGAALGVVAEDDVFRVHVKSFSTPRSFGIGDDSLGLQPGLSVALEWSAYPLGVGDYWDFVNAIRRNWNSNFTIPGPFTFATLPHDRSIDWYREWVNSRGLEVIAGGIAKLTDGRHAHGTAIPLAAGWLDHTRSWMTRLRSAAPSAVTLAYFHGQISTEPGATAKYFDARLIGPKGEHVQYPYREPRPMFLPVRGNSYGVALWQALDALIDKSGATGIYWDEMAYSVLRYAYQGPWDQVSVQINPMTHAIERRISSVALITQPLWMELIQRIRDKGFMLIANTQPVTRTMRAQRFIRFVETISYSALAAAHLHSPVGLGNHHPETTQGDAAKNAREMLRWGGVYYGHTFYRAAPEWNFISVLYPITPVEIREGMVIGKERIHTAVSGIFGWPDEAVAEVYVVDEMGARVTGDAADRIVRRIDGLYHLRLPEKHFAVLVRKR
jgi:hypothetical protein